MATTAKSKRAKGNLLQEYTAGEIRAKGLDDRARSNPDSGSGTREKADVDTSMMVLERNAGIECKNHAKASVAQWWKQTEKLESLGMEPVLVYKLFGESMEEAKVVIYLDTFLELIKKSKGIVTETSVDITPRNVLYNIERARHHMKQAMKEMGDSI